MFSPELQSPSQSLPPQTDGGAESSAPSASPSQMAGTSQAPGPASPSNAPSPQSSGQDAIKKAVAQLRGMEGVLIELATTFPPASKSLRSAAVAIRSSLREIIVNPGTAEPPVPPG